MKRKGQTTVEFALVALLVFSLLFVLLDLGMMFYVNLSMQHAVREGVRHVVVGQEKHQELRSALITTIRDCSGGLYDKNVYSKGDVLTVTVRDSRNFSNYSGRIDSEATGPSGEVIMVSLNYSWPLMTPFLKPLFTDGNYTFTVRATMRNESWDS
jgi:Flp pilus assembly protein TadG